MDDHRAAHGWRNQGRHYQFEWRRRDEVTKPASVMMKAIVAAICGLLVAYHGVTVARASDYPTQPITLIIPFAAGGPTDVVARLLSESMSRTLGQPIVIENVVGAGGTTAAIRAMRVRPPTAIRSSWGTWGRTRLLSRFIPSLPTSRPPILSRSVWRW
jgi:hypothetical protein